MATLVAGAGAHSPFCGRYDNAVNTTNAMGRAPLHAARSVEAANLLIANGGHVNARDKLGQTPLYHARERGGQVSAAHPKSSVASLHASSRVG